MVVWCESEQTAILIDFAVPQVYKREEKKYEPLAFEIKTMWGLKKVTILLVIISVNGLVPDKTVENLKKLKMPNNNILYI